MSKSMIKSFAVMAIGIFTFGFLVTTVFNKEVYADNSNTVSVTLEDKTTTKNLNLCVNNSFVSLTNKTFTTTPGTLDIKVFYGDLKGATKCDVSSIQPNKVFAISKELKSGQTLSIIAEGTAKVTGIKETYKPVLLSTTPIPGILAQNTVSWKAIANSDVKYKDAICMDNFLIAEKSAGSMQNTVIHGTSARNFSFDFTRNGAFCTASSTSPKLAIDIKCGCEGAKLYEIGLEKVTDNTNMSYTGLTFSTKVTDAPVVPTPEPKPEPKPEPTPTPEPKPTVVKTPTPVAPTAPVELAKTQTVTVRSGGNNLLLLAPLLVGFAIVMYILSKSNKLKIN